MYDSWHKYKTIFNAYIQGVLSSLSSLDMLDKCGKDGFNETMIHNNGN